MQRRHALRDDQWERIKDALPGKEEYPGRTCANNRLFIEAAMWIAKTGVPWRGLHGEHRKWSSVHKRFILWAKKGVWQMIFNTLTVDLTARLSGRTNMQQVLKGVGKPSIRPFSR